MALGAAALWDLSRRLQGRRSDPAGWWPLFVGGGILARRREANPSRSAKFLAQAFQSASSPEKCIQATWNFVARVGLGYERRGLGSRTAFSMTCVDLKLPTGPTRRPVHSPKIPLGRYFLVSAFSVSNEFRFVLVRVDKTRGRERQKHPVAAPIPFSVENASGFIRPVSYSVDDFPAGA